MSPAKSKRAYHHGDLRTALLDATVALIEAEDLGAVSLRAVARRVGVTPAAPYHHFKDKNDLLAAVGQDGFERLRISIDEAAAAADDAPTSQLRAIGVGYIQFAIAHPAHYRVMFGPDRKNEEEFPELHEAGQCCFERLVGVSAALLGDGASEAEVRRLAVTAWSAVHGLATLWNDGPLCEKFEGIGIFDLFDDLVTTLVHGARGPT